MFQVCGCASFPCQPASGCLEFLQKRLDIDLDQFLELVSRPAGIVHVVGVQFEDPNMHFSLRTWSLQLPKAAMLEILVKNHGSGWLPTYIIIGLMIFPFRGFVAG